MCEDVFYIKAYMILDNNDYGLLTVNFTTEHEIRFKNMVYDWNIVINNNNSTDSYILAEKEELNKEIKIFNRQKRKVVSIDDVDYFDAIAWSKFRYLRVKKNFKLDI